MEPQEISQTTGEGLACSQAGELGGAEGQTSWSGETHGDRENEKSKNAQGD